MRREGSSPSILKILSTVSKHLRCQKAAQGLTKHLLASFCSEGFSFTKTFTRAPTHLPHLWCEDVLPLPSVCVDPKGPVLRATHVLSLHTENVLGHVHRLRTCTYVQLLASHKSALCLSFAHRSNRVRCALHTDCPVGAIGVKGTAFVVRCTARHANGV